MKRILTPALCLSFVILTACSQASSFYQYPFSSLKVAYTITGTTQGTLTLTIKGDKSVREAHIVYHTANGDVSQDNLTIEDGQYSYGVDLDKKTATKMPSSTYLALSQIDPSMRQDYLKKIAIGVSPEDSTIPPPMSHENIAGQQCDDYDTGLGTVCLWNTIPLKTSFSIPGLTNNDVANSVQLNIDIPDSAFEIPAGIVVKDVSDVSTQQTTQQKI